MDILTSKTPLKKINEIEPLEIEEPINITIKTPIENNQLINRDETEEKQNMSNNSKKKGASIKQIEQLKKAREAKAIKKKAIQMMEINGTNEKNTSDYTQNTQNYAMSYITPLLCVLGSIGGFYILKKKISMNYMKNTQETTQEQQQSSSKIQLNF